MSLAPKDFDTDQEYLVYCAAREVYKKQNKLVPSGKYTWGRWFEKKFGMNYEGYIDGISNRARQGQKGSRG